MIYLEATFEAAYESQEGVEMSPHVCGLDFPGVAPQVKNMADLSYRQPKQDFRKARPISQYGGSNTQRRAPVTMPAGRPEQTCTEVPRSVAAQQRRVNLQRR